MIKSCDTTGGILGGTPAVDTSGGIRRRISLTISEEISTNLENFLKEIVQK